MRRHVIPVSKTTLHWYHLRNPWMKMAPHWMRPCSCFCSRMPTLQMATIGAKWTSLLDVDKEVDKISKLCYSSSWSFIELPSLLGRHWHLKSETGLGQRDNVRMRTVCDGTIFDVTMMLSQMGGPLQVAIQVHAWHRCAMWTVGFCHIIELFATTPLKRSHE